MISKKRVDIIIPAYNEGENLEPMLAELFNTLAQCTVVEWSVLIIDDGSIDNTHTEMVLIIEKYQTVRTIKLARNFGKEAAITCGLDHTEGDAVIIMDADLQHPPEILDSMVRYWLQDGFDMVVPVNKKRTGQGMLYKKLAHGFYICINRFSNLSMPLGGSDFRLIDKKIVQAIRLFPERNRFMKAIYAYPGFRVMELPYQVRNRKHGTSKWHYKKLWRFALDGLIGFTSVPLKLWTYIGLAVSLFSFLYAIYITADVVINGKETPGWATIVCLILFFNGLLMINNGIMGEYLARIFEEVKQRPLYVIDKKLGFKDQE